MGSLSRREFFKRAGILLASLFVLRYKYRWTNSAFASLDHIPMRVLGKTGVKVTSFGLGGEGVLRTVEENVRIVKTFNGLSEEEAMHLESLVEGYLWDVNYFKRGR